MTKTVPQSVVAKNQSRRRWITKMLQDLPAVGKGGTQVSKRDLMPSGFRGTQIACHQVAKRLGFKIQTASGPNGSLIVYRKEE